MRYIYKISNTRQCWSCFGSWIPNGFAGYAADGGLFVPEQLPKISGATICNMDGSISIYQLSNSQFFVFVSRIPFFFEITRTPPVSFCKKKHSANKTSAKNKRKNSTSICLGRIRWTGQEKQTASENKRKKLNFHFFGEQPGATSICLGKNQVKTTKTTTFIFVWGISPGEVLSSWSKLDFPSLAFELLKLFVQDELSSDELWDPWRSRRRWPLGPDLTTLTGHDMMGSGSIWSLMIDIFYLPMSWVGWLFVVVFFN